MTRLTITSSANPRLKTIRRLSGPKRPDGVFLVEGHRQLRHALDAGAVVREVVAAPDLYLDAAHGALVTDAERRGAHVIEVARHAFLSLSRHVRPDGVLAVVERWPTVLATLHVPEAPLIVVAEGIARPGNLGAIVRTACGAGADALVVCDTPTDLFHPDVVRGSVGTIFDLPLAVASSEEAIAWLARRGVRVVTTSPAARTAYWSEAWTGAVAVVVGCERSGLTHRWHGAADTAVAIPLPGAADSLNVAVATGIVLFEAARRRGG
jgi:TrmH family RNA methyltransferase